MTASLTYTSNEDQRTITCLPVLTIGRDKMNDIVLSDPLVSRNHAIIRLLGDEDYYLMDGGSANGSFINGKRIATPVLLQNGDRIAIGSTLFDFHQDRRRRPVATAPTDEDTTVVVTNLDIKQITILVSDIRGFTSLSEEIPINSLTRIMSLWFRHVSDCVQANAGIVDKFIGDCVYARWETATNASDAVYHTLRTAVAIHRVTQALNHENPTLPRPLAIGVGINTGQAAVGVGRDNTAIGDAVNLAFRLESATKELGKDLVLSQASYQYLPRNMWEGRTAQIAVKGKKEPVTVCGFDFAEIESLLDAPTA